MTKARTNASASPAVGRNMVINGAMNVAQRATSVTGIGANADSYFTIDRFKLNPAATAGRLTMTQTADGPNGISANCLKLDCTTADTSIAAGEALILSTYLEGQNVQRLGKGIAGAKQSVISFYVKASSSLTFAIELFDGDNARHIVKLFTATTGWNRIEFNIPADEDDGSSALDDDNAASLYINFWLHGGSTFTGGTLATAWANKTNNNTRAAGIDSFFSSTDNNFFLTGLQFEVGPVATEFEQEDISTTLAKCQRYFAIIKGTSDSAYQRFSRGHCFSTTSAPMGAFLPQNLRAFPSLGSTGTPADYHVNNGSATTVLSANPSLDNGSDFFVDGTTCNHVNFTATCSSGLTEGRGCSLNGNNSANAFISFDAEL